MALGSEIVRCWISEIDSWLAQPGPVHLQKVLCADAWCALDLFCRGENRRRMLLFSWDPEYYGCCLAREEDMAALAVFAKRRPPLLEALKSHLSGSALVAVAPFAGERLMRLAFSRVVGAGFKVERQLVFEAAGRLANLILLDETGRVIEAAKQIYPEDNRYRSILPGFPYTPPPPFENELAVGPVLARKLLEIGAAPYDPAADEMPCSQLVYQSIGPYVTAYPQILPGAAPIETKSALAATRRAVLPFLERRFDARKKELLTPLDRERKKIARKADECEKQLASQDRYEQYRAFGTLLLEQPPDAAPRGADRLEVERFTERGAERVAISLSPELDLRANARRYFDKYKRGKHARKWARDELEKLSRRLAALDEQIALVKCLDDPRLLPELEDELGEKAKKIKNEKQAKKSPKANAKKVQKTSDGIYRKWDFYEGDEVGPDGGDRTQQTPVATIYAGLSAKGNHHVTFRLARPDDIWFHVQGTGGAHVLLRLQRDTRGAWDESLADAPARALVEAAAALAAHYSAARESGHARVDYTPRKYVRAVPGGAAGFVTYAEFRSIRAVPGEAPRALEAARSALREAAGESASPRAFEDA